MHLNNSFGLVLVQMAPGMVQRVQSRCDSCEGEGKVSEPNTIVTEYFISMSTTCCCSASLHIRTYVLQQRVLLF